MADGHSSQGKCEAAIEARVRYLQLELWNKRHELWCTSVPQHPLDVLEPGVALRMRGFQIVSATAIEETTLLGDRTQIAGELDPAAKTVRISSRFPEEEQRFTAGHELGHIELGHQLTSSSGTIHRDRPYGQKHGLSRPAQEWEADCYSSYFLMPTRHVFRQFKLQFGTDRFVLTDDTAFALSTKSVDLVQERCRSDRDLAMCLVSTLAYGGRPVVPFHKIFRVSRTAMAIRLNQLNLVSLH
jgi:hypothetical protein